MSDIEALQLRVVEAAKAWADEKQGTYFQPGSSGGSLQDAVRALEQAERPDPWELLKAIYEDKPLWTHMARESYVQGRIKDALVWYDKQQNKNGDNK